MEAQITKLDDDKRLVFGWASIIKDADGKVLLDRQDDYIDSEDELEKAAYSYVLNSRDGGEMHIRKGVSTMVESVVFSKEKQEAMGIPAGSMPVGWWIGFRVNDERVWEEVKKGQYSGFSVHGTGQRNHNILKDGEYTEIEKSDKVVEKFDGVRVSKKLLVTLTKAQKNKSKDKVATVMHEFKAGKLKSSSGEKVTNPKQAIAIAISEQQRKNKKVKKDDASLVAALRVLLADSVSVYHEAHGFHWNVKGQDFSQYHDLFASIYEDIYSSVDPIAENILKLGSDAPFQLSQFVGLRSITESQPANDPMSMASELLECVTKLIRTLNMTFTEANNANQQGIANFIAERIDATQKWAWQLRSSVGIQKKFK